MQDTIDIRLSRAADGAAIESLYPEAFPDEDLLPLVGQLLSDRASVTSLVAETDSGIVGHALFTNCGVSGCAAGAALLGPVAVAPAWQRRGVGSALLRDGLRRMERAGNRLVCVLGDPAYYGRFGFAPEADVRPPYPLPPEYAGAWQSKYLDDDAPACKGELTVPAPWRQPALWS